MRIGLLGLGKTALNICKELQKQDSSHQFVGLYNKSLYFKEECMELGIYPYAYKDLSVFLDNIDWLIISIDKNWSDVIPNVLKHINKDTELTLISSTSVYGNRNGAFVNEDTVLDTSLVREHIKELINVEEQVLTRDKSYILRCGLLYQDKDELMGLVELSPTETHKYINITHRQLLYRSIYFKSAKVQNVVSQAIRLDDLLDELGIEELEGEINLYTNVRVEIK